MGADADLKKRGFKRKAPPPPLESEPLEIRTADGVPLSATVYEPDHSCGTVDGSAAGGTSRTGTIVMAHAMFARQSAFRWVAPAYRDRGWRVVTFDFRGHGRSPCARYGYDDFVERDLPAVIACVRARSDGPVALLGHSLGGHVALAAQGCGLVNLDAIVLVASNVWLRDFEPSGPMWGAKRVVLEGFVRTARRVGKFPARALRMGSDDESLEYVEDLARFAFDGRWVSRDGTRNYLSALTEVRCPIYSIASDGDRINARPVSVERMLSRCRGPIHIDRVEKSDDGSRPPGHGALLTTERAASAFFRAEAFLRTLVV
ncbi:MAG TPA: alpha/beta fold hydrolase [Polyangiaceae bacterium]